MKDIPKPNRSSRSDEADSSEYAQDTDDQNHAATAGHEIYMPSDDSFLIQKHIRTVATDYHNPTALDLCTGSGILAAELSGCSKSVVAADISPAAIEYARSQHHKANITWLKSDLFESLGDSRFDLIICNPPYLPQDKGIIEPALYGGKHGYELIIRLIEGLHDHLKTDGTLLVLFSSLSKPQKIFETLDRHLFDYHVLEKKHIFFEDLYVYRITKLPIIKSIEKEGITNLRYLTQGKRGIVFTGFYKKKKVTVKLTHPRSRSKNRIEIETQWLRRLSKQGLGPKLLMSGQDYLVYEYIDGIFIEEYIQAASKYDIVQLLRMLFDQLYLLDSLKINKQEMHHPHKNILIDKRTKRPILIDFERATYTKSPKNLSQFCQFVSSSAFSQRLKEKGIEIDKSLLRDASQAYKKHPSKQAFERLLCIISSSCC